MAISQHDPHGAPLAHYLERVSRTVQRRIPASTGVSRIPIFCGFSFVIVRCRPSALLSRLLSVKAPSSLGEEAVAERGGQDQLNEQADDRLERRDDGKWVTQADAILTGHEEPTLAPCRLQRIAATLPSGDARRAP
jgi:hypothetical protein